MIELFGYLGKATNNVAEYTALIKALETARTKGADEVEIVSDSELVVRQMLGEYRVKNPDLIRLHLQAQQLRRSFRQFSIRHVMRAENKIADRLANLAVDSHG